MGINNPMFGKTVSEETRAKISEAAKNRVKLHKPGFIVEKYLTWKTTLQRSTNP